MKSITNHTRRAFMNKDKYVGISKVGEKGQIVIPKEARDMFDIKPGDSVVVLCDKKKGMAIVKANVLEESIDKFIPKGDK
jgi:AbrB family looped-hinge helix DNA binding protein